MVNKAGDNTQPWGTPVFASLGSESAFWNLTYCKRSVKKTTNPKYDVAQIQDFYLKWMEILTTFLKNAVRCEKCAPMELQFELMRTLMCTYTHVLYVIIATVTLIA